MERTKPEQQLSSVPTPGRGFTEEHKRAVLARIRESKRPAKLRLLPWVGGFGAVVLAALLLVSPQMSQRLGLSPGEITDPTTPENLQPLMEFPPTMLNKQTYGDAMDRGGHELSIWPVVADPNYYKTHAPTRGDVVLLSERDEASQNSYYVALRVVGLPGETVEIQAGQVYINGDKLKTFYGHEYHNGLYVETSEVELEKKVVPEGHVYVMPDNWWRYRIPEEPLPMEKILGKVIGYNASKNQ